MAVPSLKINNPGNLRPGKDKWLGIVYPHYTTSGNGEFLRFETMAHGVRAQAKVLLTYQNKYKLNTIRGIINRYAPPQDKNNTSSYVKFVSAKTGFGADTTLDLKDSATMEKLLKAIHLQEHGKAVPTEDLQKGIDWALSGLAPETKKKIKITAGSLLTALLIYVAATKL